MKIQLNFQLILIFFGLDSKYREVQLEQLYILIKELNFTYTDARSLPIPYRKWFIDRLIKDLKARNGEKEDQVSHDQVEGMKSYQAMINKKFGLE
tara:strand:+ start:444 stop:728 length:285 start_codon:yes stop_codon:yes gene_type:complete